MNSTYVTLDGVIEHLEQWHFDYVDDEANAYAWELLSASDALLMGRLTYEGFAGAWSSREGQFADKINGMRKHVASTTLDEAAWNGSTLIQGDLVEEVAKLKQEPGGDILMYGFGPVAETLLQNGLLDELRLWVHPVLAGVGDRDDMLFRPGNEAKLKRLDVKPFESGLVVLSYEPA